MLKMTFKEYLDENGYVSCKEAYIMQAGDMFTVDDIDSNWSELEDEWMDHCDTEGLEAEHV